MTDATFASWFIGTCSLLLLVLILRMKKTDPVFGCCKYKRTGCKKVSGPDCCYPDCEDLGRYRSAVCAGKIK